jgi:hypothetical protein
MPSSLGSSSSSRVLESQTLMMKAALSSETPVTICLSDLDLHLSRLTCCRIPSAHSAAAEECRVYWEYTVIVQLT